MRQALTNTELNLSAVKHTTGARRGENMQPMQSAVKVAKDTIVLPLASDWPVENASYLLIG